MDARHAHCAVAAKKPEARQTSHTYIQIHTTSSSPMAVVMGPYMKKGKTSPMVVQTMAPLQRTSQTPGFLLLHIGVQVPHINKPNSRICASPASIQRQPWVLYSLGSLFFLHPQKCCGLDSVCALKCGSVILPFL
jgi:hypothetical protein